MESFDTTTLLQLLTEFNSLDGRTKKTIISELNRDWQIANSEFAEIINSIPDLARNIKNLRNVQSSTGVFPGDYFQKQGGYDFKAQKPDYVYDEESFKEAQGLYENWGKITSDYKKELKRLESGFLVPNRTRRISTLKARFEKLDDMVKKYKDYLEAVTAHTYYKRNPEQIAALRYSIMDQVKNLSYEFLEAKLQSNPELICYQPETGPENWEHHPQYICSQIKRQLLTEMSSETKQEPQEKQ